MSQGGEQQGRQQNGGGDGTPVLEWVLALVGVLVAVGVVAYLAYLGISASGGPADLRPQVIRTVDQGEEHLVWLAVENLGGSPAAAAVVEGQLYDEGTAIETSQVTIDYVPTDSASEAGLVFTVPPDEYELQLRVLGYRSP